MNPLHHLLQERIRLQGPMSFRDFMEAALYHPEYGYYSTLRGFGRAGDFITSPEIHPVFGALIGRQALDLWEALGQPAPFRILEVGAGAGALARALLDWASSDAPALARVARYTIEERSPSLRRVQQQTLAAKGVAWNGSGEPPHFVLANELLDALPVYRVVVREGHLRELRVGLDARDRFVWVEAEDIPPAVAEHLDRLGVRPPEGGVGEINTGLVAWARDLAARLERGLALVLDYGDTAEALYARPQGTLLTYYRHTLGSDPLVRVGRQDISTHVDFTTLAAAAGHAGLEVLGLVRQHRLLRHLGLRQFAVLLPGPADRRALAQLVDPRGLGRIGALFLGRRLGDYVPAGVGGGRHWEEPRFRPTLPPEPPPADFMALWREAFGESP